MSSDMAADVGETSDPIRPSDTLACAGMALVDSLMGIGAAWAAGIRPARSPDPIG